MVVNCPKCQNENIGDPDPSSNTDLFMSCETCGSWFRIKAGPSEKMACPKCGYRQDKGHTCLNCGVIFEKFAHQGLASDPSDVNLPKAADRQTGNRNRLFKSWIIFSIVYLIGVLLYSTVIYQNERNRPYRDRLTATIQQIEFSDFERQIEAIKRELEDMIDRRERKSAIYDHLESYATILDHNVAIRKSKAMIKATFRNGTILKFVDRSSSVYLIKPEIPHGDLFTVLPRFTELHTVYKNIDFEERATELQEKYDGIDYEPIEHKFTLCLNWFIPRFILLILLIWGIPVCLGFLAVCFMIRFRRV